jgi:hypothetical protein
MTIKRLPPGERPHLQRQAEIRWQPLVDNDVHPVKVAVVEALRWVGGPLSAREIWLMGVGEPLYGNVAYHFKVLVDLGLLKQSAESPARGSAERFYVVTTPAT